jgi:hypothetical protein
MYNVPLVIVAFQSDDCGRMSGFEAKSNICDCSATSHLPSISFLPDTFSVIEKVSVVAAGENHSILRTRIGLRVLASFASALNAVTSVVSM